MSSRSAATRPAGRRESRANREGRRSIDLRSGDVSGHSRQRRHRHHSEVLAPPAVNGAVTALAAALGSLFVYTVVVMFGWVFAADHSSLESMFDMASIAWLAAHLAPIEAGGEVIWLPPLLLAAGQMALAYAAGRSAMRRGGAPDGPARRRILISGVLVYALVAMVLSVLSASAEVAVSLLWGPLSAAAVFGLGFGIAVARGGEAWESLARRLPVWVGADLRAALWGLVALGVLALLALGVAVFADGDRAAEMFDYIRPGVSGSVMIALLSFIYLPTAAIWTASFLLGPGMAAGVGTIVSPFAARVGPLPDVPQLAAIPTAHAWWHTLALGAPLLAGIVAAWVAPRRGTWRRLLVDRIRISLLAGAAGVAAAWLSGGSLGGRLSDLGPAPLLVGGAVVGWFLVAALAVTMVERVIGRRPATAETR